MSGYYDQRGQNVGEQYNADTINFGDSLLQSVIYSWHQDYKNAKENQLNGYRNELKNLSDQTYGFLAQMARDARTPPTDKEAILEFLRLCDRDGLDSLSCENYYRSLPGTAFAKKVLFDTMSAYSQRRGALERKKSEALEAVERFRNEIAANIYREEFTRKIREVPRNSLNSQSLETRDHLKRLQQVLKLYDQQVRQIEASVRR